MGDLLYFPKATPYGRAQALMVAREMVRRAEILIHPGSSVPSALLTDEGFGRKKHQRELQG